MSNNCFTVDFEDWYQGIELPFSDWHKYERRIEKGFYRVLELLNAYNSKATFFTLGWIAETYPHLVKEVADAGHELGSHGYSHEKVYNQTPEEFRHEIRQTKNIIEQLTGKEVTTHRSPFFSITSKSLWALDILAEEGYKIDCSISPIKTWRYGISSCPDSVFRIKENNLIEFPVSRFSFLRKKWAVGGAYFRIFPYSFTLNGMRQRIKNNLPNMFYIHPWEYDPEHPHVKFERRAMLTHYANLKKTYSNTQKLLSRLQFDTVTNLVNEYERKGEIPNISLQVLQD